MTQQEIQERNKEIALMLGYINTTPEDKDFNIFEYPTKIGVIPNMIETMSMKFYSDWNWLMEAVEFIQKELIKGGDEFCIEFFEGLPNIPTTYVSYGDYKIESKNSKEAVFIAVSDFAKLYNNKEL